MAEPRPSLLWPVLCSVDAKVKGPSDQKLHPDNPSEFRYWLGLWEIFLGDDQNV